MKRGIKILSGCLCGLLLGGGAARAVSDSDNPYNTITNRNVFALLPPDPPAPLVPPTPPANIKLTGITTMFGNKRALLMVQDPAPGGTEQSYMLAEGQREGDVEVLAIDEEAGTVKVKNAGNEAVLSFDKDGIKLAAAPAGAAAPPAPPLNPYAPANAPVTEGSPAARAVPGLRQIPTRQLRLPGNMPGNNMALSGMNGSASLNQGIQGMNSGQGLASVQGSQPMTQNAGQPNEPESQPISPTAQRAAILIQNELHKNDPTWPQLPIPDY